VIGVILRVIEPLTLRPRLAITWIALTGFLSGLADGVLVVLAVRMALEAAEVRVNPIRVPVIGATLSEGPTIALTVALAVIAAALHLMTATNAARLSAEVLENARRRGYRAHIRARWARQQGERQGSLQETMGMANSVSESAQVMADVITSALMIFTILAIALTVSAVAVGAVVIFAIVLTFLLRPLGRRVRRESRIAANESVLLSEKIGEVTLVSRELRAFGVFDSVGVELDTLNEKSAQARRRAMFLSRYVWLLHSDIVVLFLVIAVSVVYGSRTSQFVGISTVAILVARALSSANQLQQSRSRLDELGPIVELFNDRVSALEAERVEYGEAELRSMSILQLDAVSHEYKPGVRALDSVSLEIAMGESVGLIGPSGAGKTTLIEIASRLRTATSGSIAVDGLDINDFTEESWSSQVALVPQEPHLIEGSVRDNIRFHRDWITDDAIVAAAEAAHVRHEIERLPESFDTLLGPHGTGVSVGQKQRIAIARALAGQPSMLVLDEPTSALDPRSERMLRATLDDLHGSVAMVMVTHRMSTVDICDRLVVVDAGKIVATGPVDQIMTDESLHDLTRATMIDNESSTANGEAIEVAVEVVVE
jgi:ATP-binding cassette subfamily B protein